MRCSYIHLSFSAGSHAAGASLFSSGMIESQRHCSWTPHKWLCLGRHPSIKRLLWSVQCWRSLVPINLYRLSINRAIWGKLSIHRRQYCIRSASEKSGFARHRTIAVAVAVADSAQKLPARTVAMLLGQDALTVPNRRPSAPTKSLDSASASVSCPRPTREARGAIKPGS